MLQELSPERNMGWRPHQRRGRNLGQRGGEMLAVAPITRRAKMMVNNVRLSRDLASLAEHHQRLTHCDRMVTVLSTVPTQI